jgi:hypothetical protein
MKFSIIVPLAAPAAPRAPSAMRAAAASVGTKARRAASIALRAAVGAAHIQNFHAHIMIHN